SMGPGRASQVERRRRRRALRSVRVVSLAYVHAQLVENLVAAQQNRLRNHNVESLGSPQVDCQLERGRLLEGNDGRLCASQYLRYLIGRLAETICHVGAVRDKSPRLGIFGAAVYAWQA